MATQQERRQITDLCGRQVKIRHTQSFGLALDLALVINVRLRQFVFEESLVVVPVFLCWSLGKPRQILFIFDGLGAFAAALRDFGK